LTSHKLLAPSLQSSLSIGFGKSQLSEQNKIPKIASRVGTRVRVSDWSPSSVLFLCRRR